QGNGANTAGGIFTVDLGGTGFTSVYNFGGIANDGADPQASPVLGSNGQLFGTTAGGGANNQGTVYVLRPGLLAAPTGLTAVAGDTQIMLTWNAVPGASSYNVYRSTTPGGEGATPITTGLTTPSFLDTGLSDGQVYFYKVTAVVSAVETAQSSEVSAQPLFTARLHSYSAGLQMISVPSDYTGFAPWQCFDAGPITLATWTNGAYVISPNAPANVLVPGAGYWVRLPVGGADLLNLGIINSGTGLVQVPLVQGWNLIGDPQPFDVSVAFLKVQTGSTIQSFLNANKAGIVGPSFYTFQPGDVAYEVLPASSSTLDEFKGYWVFAFKACTLIFPAAS
ncbi:MAG TPA: fibronectin type III domain-containing protein, partial [Capsulimonadaceae bacterium]|nr:fibronectin type III domain-containing protein [Capsulimonadaceae bacterium]